MKSPLEAFLREALGNFSEIAQREEYRQKLRSAALNTALERLNQVNANLPVKKKRKAINEAIRPDLIAFYVGGAEHFVDFLLRSRTRKKGDL